MRDTVMEYARNVLVPIPHRIGKYIKVQLYFDARWLMLSEVQFGSSKYTERKLIRNFGINFLQWFFVLCNELMSCAWDMMAYV